MSIVDMKILGQRLAVKSDEDEEHIKSVESYLNCKVSEIKESSKAVSTLDVALLAALNVTGELIKIKETLEKRDKRSEALSDMIERGLE